DEPDIQQRSLAEVPRGEPPHPLIAIGHKERRRVEHAPEHSLPGRKHAIRQIPEPEDSLRQLANRYWLTALGELVVRLTQQRRSASGSLNRGNVRYLIHDIGPGALSLRIIVHIGRGFARRGGRASRARHI